MWCTPYCVFPYSCVVCVSVQLEHITEQREAVPGGADKSPKLVCRSSTEEAVRHVSGQLLSRAKMSNGCVHVCICVCVCVHVCYPFLVQVSCNAWLTYSRRLSVTSEWYVYAKIWIRTFAVYIRQIFEYSDPILLWLIYVRI